MVNEREDPLQSLNVFSGCDVPWLLEQQARARPDKTFLIWEPVEAERRSWTFREFCEETRAYAAGFEQRGVRAGDFVTLHMENCPEFLFAWFACSHIGAVAVTTNTGSSQEEFDYFIADSRSTVVVTQPKFVALARNVPSKLRWIARTDTDSGAAAEQPCPNDVVGFEDLRGDPSQHTPRAIEPARRSHVQYTSGTTSRPKGVVWTHANALWAAKVTTSHAHLTASDVVPVFFPLFHANAMAYTVLPTLWSGGTAVLMPKYSSSRFWDIAVRNRCTWANMVTFTIRALEKMPDPEHHYFRLWALLAQAPIVRQRWGIPAVSWYGMTETITQNIHSHFELDTPAGAIGRPALEYGIAVRRSDGSDAQPGEAGRLWVRGIRGLSMFLEYLNQPEATRAAFDDHGWFDTGDEVETDEQGNIHFLGRAKDMLRVGDENVAASEIETVINRVAGVIECAVIGKPDQMLDEVPIAFVVAREPSLALEAEILSLCAKALSRFKQPREIHFIDALPKGLLDKTLKRHLRSRLKG